MMEKETAMTTAVDPAEAARQLADLEQSRAELARRIVAPWWYHPALGLVTASMIAMLAAPLVWRLVHLAFVFGACWLLMRAYKRRTGVWVHGWRAGRTRWVSAGLAAVVLAVGLASVGLWLATGEVLIHFVAAGLVAVLVTAAGPLWEAAFRRDLGAGR